MGDHPREPDPSTDPEATGDGAAGERENRERPSGGSLADRRGEDLDVYGPAEDSALLAGEAAADLAAARPALVLDVGTGSGYVGERVAAATDARVVGVDVNPAACRRARARELDVVRGDLVGPFRDGAFDAVTCNPPYLPANVVKGAEPDDWFAVAVSGGQTGRELVDRLLADVGRVLAPDGAAYLLVSTYTGVEAVVERAAERDFSAVALADASFPGETLTVLKLVR